MNLFFQMLGILFIVWLLAEAVQQICRPGATLRTETRQQRRAEHQDSAHHDKRIYPFD